MYVYALIVLISGAPAWVPPVAIGGAVVAFLAVSALLVFLVLNKCGGNRSSSVAAVTEPDSDSTPM